MDLDRQSKEIVLGNLRDAARLSQWKSSSMTCWPPGSVAPSSSRDGREPVDVYRRQDNRWTGSSATRVGLLLELGRRNEERDLLRALRRMLNIDDPERVAVYREMVARANTLVASLDERERRSTDAPLRPLGNPPHLRRSPDIA